MSNYLVTFYAEPTGGGLLGGSDPLEVWVEPGGYIAAIPVTTNPGYTFVDFTIISGTVGYFDPSNGLLISVQSDMVISFNFSGGPGPAKYWRKWDYNALGITRGLSEGSENPDGYSLRLVRGSTSSDPDGTIYKNDYVGINGTVYDGVKIGSRVWLVGNLKETQYANGDPIPNITDSTEWASTEVGAMAHPNNDSTLFDLYGGFYNAETILDPRGLVGEEKMFWDRVFIKVRKYMTNFIVLPTKAIHNLVRLLRHIVVVKGFYIPLVLRKLSDSFIISKEAFQKNTKKIIQTPALLSDKVSQAYQKLMRQYLALSSSTKRNVAVAYKHLVFFRDSTIAFVKRVFYNIVCFTENLYLKRFLDLLSKVSIKTASMQKRISSLLKTILTPVSTFLRKFNGFYITWRRKDRGESDWVKRNRPTKFS